ncbi:MAG: alpha-N-acetylglucosaminidase [Bacteroidaceae bacterium]|nr:alpha-N-acetylglucosaminidase [Bacteroidaceae bacterium]
MKRFFLLIFSFSHFLVLSAADPIADLLQRVLPENGDAQRFEWTVTDQDSSDQYFTLSCDGDRVRVEASDNVAVATGINWYLQHYAGVDISWNSPTATLPRVLPVVRNERHTSSVDYRYYLNFCTHSYSMAFWGWERWQQEIDWMALHGVNLPLVITGMEGVWRQVLEDYGYGSLNQVNEFVCGSAFYGWFFMNNLTGWGGPQPDSWYRQRTELARRIFQRMSDLGMTPVVPGYVGMVPQKFLSYAAADKVQDWQASDIVNGGKWCSFQRPYFVNNTDRLKEFAAAYYTAFDKLFGDCCTTHFYAIDPFHEGGVPSGVTSASASVKAMYDALLAYDAEAVWVCQHWQDNPTNILTHTVPAGRLMILDLHGDNNGDVECSGNHTTADGTPHDWVWGQVSNFGGNVGLFGRMDRLINCFYKARDNAASNHLVGIGAIPEGIENNSMLYDLLYALPWTNSDYTRQTWLADYVQMRYGVRPGDVAYAPLLSAWTRLVAGPYNCPNDQQQGTTESVFLMRPALKPGTVSSWANSTWYWDFFDLRTALYEMLSVAETLKDNDNFRYDLVDLMRQSLADLGKLTLDSITSVTGTARTALADRFLTLILDQDRLLGTRAEFRLGRWTEMARALGTTDDECTLYEKNARMLLTTWGDRAQCEAGGLHDYANREWNGLLSSYYYPRWKAFFARNYQAQSWFANYEWPFVSGTSGANAAYLPEGVPYGYGTFQAEAVGDEIAVVKELYAKYFHDFRPEIWTRVLPDTQHTYMLTNAQKWYREADSEGLNLTLPNNDYKGYRLKRSALKASDTAYQWRFVTSPTDAEAVRLQNVYLQELNNTSAPSFLSSKPSTAAYPAFTFAQEGTDFYLYQCDERYYLQEAGQEVYMAPDCAWAEACVLVSQSRSATACLHLTPVTPTGVTSLLAPVPETPVYDLSGRRISSSAHSGIHIKEGKKHLVR